MSEQPVLPGFEHVPILYESDYPQKIIFYYILSPTGDECIILDGMGNFVKTEHNLQHIIPHLFNSFKQAILRRDIENLKGWKVVRYPYQYGWWNE